MIKLVVGGATGKLGRVVCSMATTTKDIEITGGTASNNGGNIGTEIVPGVYASSSDILKKLLDNADVYVDLTTPMAASKVVMDVPSTGTNIVVGTTSVDKRSIEIMCRNIENNKTSGVVSANFARGVNVFWKMCETMASLLKGYDIEVLEAHHHFKKDSPSGTAMEAVKRMQSVTGIDKLTFGRQGIVGSRNREIGIHSIRAGDIFGDHTTIFAGSMEMLELKHRSISREALAQGCLETVRWISGKKDGKLHTMNEVFDL
ncbi:MAG: 4-hydroxy-tetrahydrodipicolinate reductase [archaeon]|nr:4-hydroxy-tetrahydrodipicolinate reductase [archaeon]